ncbi:MAG: ABC transporter ATP-binding protein [Bradymonadales bacterium]|nr:ABC transporter ATP-binding protein [Bradymonadales bacterium]
MVALDKVTRLYRMGDVEVQALRQVSTTIQEGEFVAVMGSSGSGKSTLMNILGCLDRPTSGRYLLWERDVSRLGRADLAEIRNQTLGFVFQNFNLLARTSALENVELPLIYGGLASRKRHRRATEALQRVGLGDRMDHHPNQLSGGQQQRVAIARAIVSDPRLILADEPTGNLDSRTTAEIMGLFAELNQAKMTIVLVTHEVDVAAYASRILWMKDGQVVLDQPHTPSTPLVLSHPDGDQDPGRPEPPSPPDRSTDGSIASLAAQQAHT